jgi:hypothetical protein
VSWMEGGHECLKLISMYPVPRRAQG